MAGFAFFQPLNAAEFGRENSLSRHRMSQQYSTCSTDTIFITPEYLDRLALTTLSSPDPIKKKKFISALFALPFPFGFVGAHRVILGTGPWVPVVYVATLGGCFGLLPLIDFCFITFSKDITPFENNSHIFMWIK